MPTVKHRHTGSEDSLGERPNSESDAGGDSTADLKRSVIELGDLTSGPEAEMNKLRSGMITMSVEIEQIRSGNVKLAGDYQKLTTEMREIKLVLAKVHVKELRAIERRSVWLQSLNTLQRMFGKNHDKPKIGKSKNRSSFTAR